MTAQTEFARFASWLAQGCHRDDRVGEPARAVRDDSTAPTSTVIALRCWLRWYGPDGSVAALEAAVGEFRNAEATRVRRVRNA